MEEDIKNIQNGFWKIYKRFTENKDMAEYNNSVRELVGKYKGDKFLFPFCQNLAITWAPVINKLKGSI